MNNDRAGTSQQSAAAKAPQPLEADEDGPLVDRALLGHAEAFEALFVKYRQRLFTVAWRLLRDEDGALDIVQDAFVKAYEQLEKLRGDGHFFPWIRRIAINLAIDRLRHIRRGVEVSMEDHLSKGEDGEQPAMTELIENPKAEDPVAMAEQSEFSADFSKALAKLSEPHRTVFLLHSAEGLSYKEISGLLGCNMGTVMSRLFYARKQLQELLKPHLR